MNKFIKSGLVAASFLSFTAAHAALPPGAEAAITGVGTDVVEAIGLVILAGIAIYAAKKLGQKMGWL